MRTSWSNQYLERTHGSPRKAHEWKIQRKRQFEQETGIAWDWYSAHERVIFHPTWTSDTEPVEDQELADRILELAPVAYRARSFTVLAEGLNAELAHLVAVVKWMVQSGQATAIVGRTGRPMGVHKRSR